MTPQSSGPSTLLPDNFSHRKDDVDDGALRVDQTQMTNDFDLTPSKTLAIVMKAANKTYELKIYPPYGNSQGDGHSFGYFGSAVWANDVFRFLNRYCRK
jgi:hypothetical protein